MTCETCKTPVGEGRIWVAPGRVVCSMACADRLEPGFRETEEKTVELDIESMLAVIEGGLR